MPIRIACALYDGFQLTDLAGPAGAFEMAAIGGAEGYVLEPLASSARLVRSSSGMEIAARAWQDSAGFDMLLVPGGVGIHGPAQFADIVPLIREADARGRRIVSLAAGAFLLAEAGVLEGRRAVTHWGLADRLEQHYPSISFHTDQIYLCDGHIWTSAGLHAGIDLALAIIALDYGASSAQFVARALMVPYRRPAGQAQQSLMLDLAADGRFAELLAWAQEHLSEPLGVERLAERAALSTRQFTRAFHSATGLAPAKAIEALRVERARATLEAGVSNLDEVAQRAGFGSAERMRRAFVRLIGLTPQQLRRQTRRAWS